MELSSCAGIVLGVLVGLPCIVALVMGAITLYDECERKRMMKMAKSVPLGLLLLICGIGFSLSQVTWKSCGEEDSITRAIEAAPIFVVCNCGK